MPFTAQEIQDAGKIGLDFYLKNKPVDQIGVERPFLAMLNAGKKSAPGAKQYIVVQLRYRYQSNFQWFNGSQVVTYNRRQSVEQANWAWRSAHDGFALDEDRLIQNGITVTDDGPGGNASGAERLQLTSLIEEQSAILRLGFEEKFSQACHLDGTQSTDALTGLDAMVQTSSTWGTLGGIDASTSANTWWRNHRAGALTTTTTTGTILTGMETAWRACVRNGGRPTHIFAGSDFIDGFRNFMLNSYGKLEWEGAAERTIEGGTKELLFHGVPITWSPEFADLDSLYAPATTWEKRCYFVNANYLQMMPMAGQDMITRKPPRAYDKYEYYWGITWRGAIVMSRRNAHSVVYI